MSGSGHDHPADVLLIEDDPADALMVRESFAAANPGSRLHVIPDGTRPCGSCAGAASTPPRPGPP